MLTKDGIDHINIYSKGETELGRLLSNFAHTPFVCKDGRFASLEGYWYWLSVSPNNPRRDELRRLWGFQAKKLGRDLRGRDWNEDEEFRLSICEAIVCKVEQNRLIEDLLKASQLPFEHYYIMDGNVVPVKGADWLINFIANYRMKLQYPEVKFV